MNTATTPQGVRHVISKSAITLDKIGASEFQKEGTLSAQIRQTVTRESYYPSKKTSSSMQANIFDNKDFGFEEQRFESVENRIAWIPVPTNITEAEVKAKLEAAQKNGACIYRVLSNKPILDENQKYAVEQGLRTLDMFANAQVVRYPKGSKDEAGNDNAGKIWTDASGNVQYRRTFFWLTAMEDFDARDKGESYVSPEIKAELAGASVMTGQTI